MSTQFVDRKIHNILEKKKNWEEQGHTNLDAVLRSGCNMDVTVCSEVYQGISVI